MLHNTEIRCFQSGLTLIELILSMVIISIAVTGLFSVINLTVSRSSDPIIQHQAIAIAESYLEEILLQSYTNPSDGYSGVDRGQFDDVDDYNGLSDTGVRDSQGDLVAILANYNVSVSVAVVSLADSVSAKKIIVNVTGLGSNLKLVGYRVNI
jgi:MSHA pilin protein MshD